jgi:hypothetical protein
MFQSGNKLFLFDFIMDGDRNYLGYYHSMDIVMMMLFGSREKTLEQYTSLLGNTGLE